MRLGVYGRCRYFGFWVPQIILSVRVDVQGEGWIRSLPQALRFPLFEEKIHHCLPVHGMKCDGEDG